MEWIKSKFSINVVGSEEELNQVHEMLCVLSKSDNSHEERMVINWHEILEEPKTISATRNIIITKIPSSGCTCHENGVRRQTNGPICDGCNVFNQLKTKQ